MSRTTIKITSIILSLRIIITITSSILCSTIAYANENSPKDIHILFIGNSYTYTHNMPDILVKIAASNTRRPIRLHVDSVTQGGAGLKDLWDGGRAFPYLEKSMWNFIVLQEQSLWAFIPQRVRDSYEVAPKWKQKIAATNAHTVLFVTWARQPGSHWYINPETAFLKNPHHMQQTLDSYSAPLAEKLGASMLPIGDYWAYALATYPNLPLYDADGSHPSIGGSYLTALIFYRYFTQNTLEHVTYVPDKIPADIAAQIRAVASAQDKPH